ncbi:MAG: helix-turn-helix transcriptional regulator [Puniceicoccales bacterium]
MSATRPLVENWNDLTTRLIWAYDGPVRERFRHAHYRPEGVAAWFIREGSVTLEFESGRESYACGAWVFPRKENGMQYFSEGSVILSVRFMAEWKEGIPLFDCSKSRTLKGENTKKLTNIAERLARSFVGVSFENATMERVPQTHDMYFNQQRLFYAWMLAYSKAMEEYGLTADLANPLDDRVSTGMSIMDRRRLQDPITEQQVADIVGISVTQLNRLFVAQLGMTAAEYWETRRKRMALNLIQTTSRSIKTISYDLGFSSLSHFSVWVKKRFGMSPRELRKIAAVESPNAQS